MRKIKLETSLVRTGDSHTSKGNQLKWHVDGKWYKADAFGYESLAETLASRALAYANLDEVVSYEPVEIQYKETRYRGCVSDDFLAPNEELVPLERLVRAYTGIGLADRMARMELVRDRIVYTEETVRILTGITDFGAYLTKLLAADAFFYNEDRHTNNLALIFDREKKTYRPAPVFDMGLSLFSDTREAYPLAKPYETCVKEIKAKPFSTDFEEQLDAAEALFGAQFSFVFPEKSTDALIEKLFDGIAEFSEAGGEGRMLRTLGDYTQEEVARAEWTLRRQLARYEGYVKTHYA